MAPPIKPTAVEKSWWGSWGEAVHTGLDIVGLIPGVGEIADGANAVIYLAEGDKVNAAISAAAMIPGVGMAATGAKLGGKVVGAAAEGAWPRRRGAKRLQRRLSRWPRRAIQGERTRGNPRAKNLTVENAAHTTSRTATLPATKWSGIMCPVGQRLRKQLKRGPGKIGRNYLQLNSNPCKTRSYNTRRPLPSPTRFMQPVKHTRAKTNRFIKMTPKIWRVPPSVTIPRIEKISTMTSTRDVKARSIKQLTKLMLLPMINIINISTN